MIGTLHQHLKAHRKLRKFTQVYIAGILRISHNAYSDKENGKRPVTLEELEKIAEAYGVHPSALLMAPEDGPRADLMRRAAEIARTRPESAAQDWVRSGEHLPPHEKTSQ
jgi:transcriptional regulator with XRE-family HTH domain